MTTFTISFSPFYIVCVVLVGVQLLAYPQLSATAAASAARHQYSYRHPNNHYISSTGTGASTSSSASSTNTHRRYYKQRSACRFFLWDAVSACRYNLCNRLLTDCVYEGLGGKKFVRIKPGSLLESLYPPSQHGPDKCLICGLSFRDHLTCWWYPQLYSPYDLYLDAVKKNGTVVVNADVDTSTGRTNFMGSASGVAASPRRGRNRKNKNKKRKHNTRKSQNRNDSRNRGRNNNKSNLQTRTEYESGLSPLYNDGIGIGPGLHQDKFMGETKLQFHTRYVRDLGVGDGGHNYRSYTGRNKDKRGKKQGWWQGNSNGKRKKEDEDLNDCSVRKVLGSTIAIPKLHFKNKGTFKGALLVVARIVVLERVEHLLLLQKMETGDI